MMCPIDVGEFVRWRGHRWQVQNLTQLIGPTWRLDVRRYAVDLAWDAIIHIHAPEDEDFHVTRLRRAVAKAAGRQPDDWDLSMRPGMVNPEPLRLYTVTATV